MKRLAAILIAIAVIRVAATYRVFSATADEATHVGAGMEIYQWHQYRLQRINPPVARAILGIAPTLGGMRFNANGDFGAQLQSVFYGPVNYETSLVLGRIGNLVFLILAASTLFFVVRRASDESAAVVAVFLFTFEPVILGHSGLATNDAAATAGLAVAILAFDRWLELPTWRRAAMVGVAWAFAILCKFSHLFFVPLTFLAMGAVVSLRDQLHRRKFIHGARTLVVIPLILPLAIWAGYAFAIGTVGDLNDVRDAFGPRAARFIATHASTPLPAPGFFYGVGDITLIDRAGHDSYFFGQASRSGWLLYFPTTILLKTTMAILAFIVAGIWFTRREPRLQRLFIGFTAASILILAFSARSKLDLGIRYVLPIFIPMTIAATASATAMLRASRKAAFVACALLAWHAVASIAAHPDYFPYFNALAGDDPSRYLIDSNLDWGQDVLRLRDEIRRRHIDRIGVSIMGSAVYDKLGFPSTHDVDSLKPENGWVAVSDHIYRMNEARWGGFRWLNGKKFARVGKTIRLFHFLPNEFPAHETQESQAGILLPLAGNTGAWRVRQQVTNSGATSVRITTNACAHGPWCSFDLAGGQTVAIVASWPRNQYVLLTTRPGDAAQLHTLTVLERTDGVFRAVVPEVRERDFRSGSMTMHDVPVTPKSRLNLRMWALNSPGAAGYSVRVVRDGKTLAERPFATGEDGFVTDSNLIGQFPELAGRELRADIVVTRKAGGDDRLWGFITATDNQTNLPVFYWPR